MGERRPSGPPTETPQTDASSLPETSTRREFLKEVAKWAGGVALAGALGEIPHQRTPEPLPFAPEEQKDKPEIIPITEMNAEQALEAFPEKIPGARSVEKSRTPGARHCLVHIKQRHETRWTTKKEKQEIQVIQTKIYKILFYLVRKNKIKEVYEEGATEKIVELLEVFITIFKNLITNNEDEIIKARAESIQSPALRDINQKFEAELQKINADYERIVANRINDPQNSAVEKLTLRGIIKIIPAEASLINMWANALEKKIIGDLKAKRDPTIFEAKRDLVVLELREAILLQMIHSQNKPFAITVFGAGHDWKNNIEHWNSVHPEAKFCLIEVTPEALTKIESQSKDE